MTPTPTGLAIWAAFALAVYVVAIAIGLVTRQINPDQRPATAWRYAAGPFTLDLSPWTLDVPLRYRPKLVHGVLDGWAARGRSLALWLHLTLDVLFPLSYSVALWMAISLVARPQRVGEPVLTLILALPVAAAGADWLENGIIVGLSRTFPPRSATGLSSPLWVVSLAKWVLLLVSVAVLISLGVADLNGLLAAWGVPEPHLSGWQSFYASTAGGSAAILGLFYVAQSIQPPAAARHQAGRRHVAVTSTVTTVMILLISLAALWAQQSTPLFGAICVVLIAGYAVVSLWHQRYVGKNLRYQRWRRARVAGAVIGSGIIVLGGVEAMERSRAGLPLVAAGVMISFALWAITALALLYPQPEAETLRHQRS